MRLIIVWLIVVVTGTLAPFIFVGPPLEAFKYGPHQQQGTDLVLNLLLFIPFGVWLHHNGQRSSDPIPALIAAALGAIALSACIEYAQAFIPGRDSSLIDVLANTAGACVGLLAARHTRFARRDSGLERQNAD